MPLNEKGSYNPNAGSNYDAPPSYDLTSPGPSASTRTRTSNSEPQPRPRSPRPPAPSSPFAPSPDGTSTPGPELSGDNPHGFMGHVKDFSPGQSPQALLDPLPPSFLRPPAPGLPYAPFPAMLLLSKGATLDRGFSYAAPGDVIEDGVEVGAHAHPFAGHDVSEQDWRPFLHDVRVAGSLSPLNRVVAGLALLALGIWVIFGFFVVKGVDSVMRRTKKGLVSQLIDHWDHVEPKVRRRTRGAEGSKSQAADKNRL